MAQVTTPEGRETHKPALDVFRDEAVPPVSDLTISHWEQSREKEFRGGKLVAIHLRTKPVFADEAIESAQPVGAGLDVGGVPVLMGETGTTTDVRDTGACAATFS